MGFIHIEVISTYFLLSSDVGHVLTFIWTEHISGVFRYELRRVYGKGKLSNMN